MQLGELQHQKQRFDRRQAQILGVSVDTPTDSLAMMERLGLTFDLLSDPDQALVKAFGVQNPDTKELALHAVYVIAQNGDVVYRKVGLRRPVSAELIDAIDAHLGQYPQTDEVLPRKRSAVAYPRNDFQAIIEVARAPAELSEELRKPLESTMALIRSRQSDDAVFAFRRYLSSVSASEEELRDVVRWMVAELFFGNNTQAETVFARGRDLSRRLARVSELSEVEAGARGTDAHDQALHQLAAARAGLVRARTEIEQNAQAWRLRSVKTSLRAHFELVAAHLRSRDSSRAGYK